MFRTSSCGRKLPTHSTCHAEFWADFPFLFPFSPLSNLFSSKSIQKLLPNCLPPLLFRWHHSLPKLPLVFSLLVKARLHFLGQPLCLPLLHFPSSLLLLFTNCDTGLSFLMSCCWEIYSSLLLAKEVFPFLYPRLSQASSKPISFIYVCLRIR